MKMPVVQWLRKAQLHGILLFGTMPLIYVLTGEKAPALHPWAWVFPAVWFLLSMISMGIPGKWRFPWGIAVAVGMLACSVLLAPAGCIAVSVMGALFYAGLLLWSLRLGGQGSTQELPDFWLMVGLVLHLGGLIALHSDRVSKGMNLVPTQHWLYLSLYLFVLLTMLSMNRRSLITASGKRQRASASMRRQNILLTGALFGIGVAFSAAPSVMRWIKALLLQLWNWLNWLARLLSPEEGAGVQAVPAAESAPQGMPAGGEEASAMALFLEKILLAVGGLLSLAVLAFLLIRLWRSLRKLVKRLMAALGRMAVSASEDYVDEITDTRGQDPGHFLGRNPIPRISRREARAMDPGQRIRWLYGRKLHKHPEWGRGSTARENLPEEPASLYERARYSPHPLTPEEAEEFAGRIQKI